MTPEEYETFFLIKGSDAVSARYNIDKEFISILKNKAKTNTKFAELVNRAWCINKDVSEEEFRELFKDCNKIIYKPLKGNRGYGVQSFDINEKNIKEVYEEISKMPKAVIEEYVMQHKVLKELCPSSVNTVRIVTISSNTTPVTEDGKMMDVAYAALRIGGGSSVVDNFHSGGMVAIVDVETGKLVTDAADMECNVFKTHPVTGVTIKGLEIPYFKEAVELVKKSVETHKVEGYLGWDIGISENGPVLIELNASPGVVLLQTPWAAEHKGMKPLMEKYLYELSAEA